MGMSAVQFKIMPESPEQDLEAIKKVASSKIEELGGKVASTEEQPIAFGLKALIVVFAFPEENDVDQVGNVLGEIEGVSSTEMIDYRRALG
jgi:elongation factor 1-beta